MNRSMKDSPAATAREARLIARRALSGALATSRRAKRNTGQPYVSKVGVALMGDGSPLFLFSTLAAHTQDLLAEPRCSLLVESAHVTANSPASSPVSSPVNPLESARATLVGKARKLTRPKDIAAARAVYLARHPGAARYVDFGDFAFWRLDVQRVHFVGGFGRAKWAKGGDYLHPCDVLMSKRDDLLQVLNDRHTADLNHVAGPGRSWRAVGVDADGLDLAGPRGGAARIDFPSPASTPKGWRGRFSRRAKR